MKKKPDNIPSNLINDTIVKESIAVQISVVGTAAEEHSRGVRRRKRNAKVVKAFPFRLNEKKLIACS